MNHRSTFALFITASVFTAFVLVFDCSLPVGEKNTDFVFPGLSFENVREITLTAGSFQTVLNKSFFGWRCAYIKNGKKLVDDYADRKRIRRLLDDLSTLQPATPPLTLKQNTWASYGLGSLEKTRGNSILLKYGASRHTLYLGKSKMQGTLPLVYVRKDEEAQLLEIDARICHWLDDTRNNANSMRTKNCFHLLGDTSPELLLWQNKGEKVILRHRDNRWFFENGERASARTCQRLLEAMQEMRIFKFCSPEQENFLSLEKLAAHDYQLLGYKNAESEEYVIIKASRRLKAKIGDLVTEVSCNYAGRAFFSENELKIDYGYFLTSTSLKQIPLQSKEFKDLRLLPFSPIKAERITRKGTKNWQIERKHHRWQVTAPRQGKLDFREVQDFLQALGSLNADSFVSEAKLVSFDQSLTLEFSLDSRKLEIDWSETMFGRKSAFVRVKGEKTIRLLNPAKIELLAKNYSDFYCKRADAFNFSSVMELDVIRPDRVYRIYKRDDNWWLQQPLDAPAEKKNVEDILRNCAWVMAKRVLAEESERGRYGCLNANYKLKIHTRAEENSPALTREIEIGDELKGGYCAIWISGFPYVYKVKSNLKQALKRELHYCGWLPKGQKLAAAKRVAITHGHKRFYRDKGRWTLNGEEISKGKAIKIAQLLAQIRIEKFIVFHSRSKPRANSPLMVIEVTCANDQVVSLEISRSQDRLLGAFSTGEKIFLLENAAVAVLLQETE